MLKNIRLHIENDEDRQNDLEREFAQQIATFHKDNLEAFRRNIPSLVPTIQGLKSHNISVFVNKWGRVNIVDYGTGRTLYGFNPQQEIRQSVDEFFDHASYFSMESSEQPNSKDKSSLETYLSFAPMPDDVEVFVSLGLGLGEHLLYLLENKVVRHLIVYEPELQYFSCALMAFQWKRIFELAKQKNTAIYLQIGKDGRDLVEDISELHKMVGLEKVYLYPHYHHRVFDSVFQTLLNRPWSEVKRTGISYSATVSREDFCDTWTAPISKQSLTPVSADTDLFERNLSAFQKYLPDVYQQFKDYKPTSWLPMRNENGSMNLLHHKTLANWYGPDAEHESITSFEGFSQYPNRDGLALGYSGQKLKHYLHYQFVSDTDQINDEIEDELGALPQNIKSLIMFGVGVGYQLVELFKHHKVDNLFICEPNRDFFYASLSTIDWHDILTQIEQNEGRLYLNVGDDGSNLFRDLLNQFYAIGPYALAHTYFYQCYYNSALNEAIAQLREQLQVVIAMGEYFDHAFFGINHTVAAIESGVKVMGKNPASKLSHEQREFPIFLVGNGPSLDSAIDAIRAEAGNAVVISCGTSLQVLYKNGIVPDFHAEIEQNRCTFDWCSRVGNYEYLKKIKLISCNGIHPDTCSLFADCYIAFKEGESSTVSSLNVMGEASYEVLKYAFPTVTNFALNFFLKLGFNQIYLFGVDLGFLDSTKHHSNQSGYYSEDGKQIFNHSEKLNTAIQIRGNFRPVVYTKQEFKIAKMVMEQSLRESKAECYNTSDGAYLQGSRPLPLDSLLILSSVEKGELLEQLLTSCFSAQQAGTISNIFEKHYSQSVLSRELESFEQFIGQNVESFEEAERMIEKQKMLLFQSYKVGKSLLFYYLYGTSNYANALLAKCLYSYSDKVRSIELFNRAREIWLHGFKKLKQQILQNRHALDHSHFLAGQRVNSYLSFSLQDKRIQVYTDSSRFTQSMHTLSEEHGFDCEFLPCTQLQQADELSSNAPWFIYSETSNLALGNLQNIVEQAQKRHNRCTVIFNKIPREPLPMNPYVTYVIVPGDTFVQRMPIQCNDMTRARLALQHFVDGISYGIVVSKFYIVTGHADFLSDFEHLLESKVVYDGISSVVLSEKTIKDEQLVIANGTRLFLSDKTGVACLVSKTITEPEHIELQRALVQALPFIEGKEPNDV